jgi:LuxR family maltose regulon positive regulatory protein
MSLHDSYDPADFVQRFSGSDRYVIDYLMDEVLQRQPARMRQFLQQTAVLKELSAPLCDFVTGREDSATILQEVERANLFLIPLDNRREWYRYHHLFAEVLVTAADEGETQALHRRAANWYEAHGRPSRAIHHALASRDLETVVRLIKDAVPDQLQQAGFVRVLSWLDALPDEMVRSNTELATYKGYILLWRGEIEAAESYADAAEGSLPEEAPAATRGRFLTLRAHLCPDRGSRLIHYATEAIELLDESTPFFYGAALLMLATGHKMSGNVAEMMEVYRRLARLEERRNPFMAATAIAEIAGALRLQGKRREALLLCQRAMEQYTDSRGQPLPSLIVVLLMAAMLARETNELTLALERAEQSAIMAQQTGMSFLAAQCKCYVDVPCRWALGERAAAWAALQQARDLIADDHPLYLEASLDAGSWEAWLNLRQGDVAAAARWAANFDFPPGFLHYDLSAVYLTYARVLLAQDRYQEGAEALQRLETWARASGWERVLLSVAILRAIAAQKSGDETSALDCLAQAVHLAAEEDYRRAFLDEDPVIFELLPGLRVRLGGTIAPAFVDSLLKDLADERRRTEEGVVGPPSSVVRQQSLIEPLSERELDVLRLLAEGLTTPNIAERLYISAGTAKWHTINIYRKLDVHSRVQAVARAHELGLI